MQIIQFRERIYQRKRQFIFRPAAQQDIALGLVADKVHLIGFNYPRSFCARECREKIALSAQSSLANAC